jgi:hypothetical protein
MRVSLVSLPSIAASASDFATPAFVSAPNRLQAIQPGFFLLVLSASAEH